MKRRYDYLISSNRGLYREYSESWTEYLVDVEGYKLLKEKKVLLNRRERFGSWMSSRGCRYLEIALNVLVSIGIVAALAGLTVLISNL